MKKLGDVANLFINLARGFSQATRAKPRQDSILPVLVPLHEGRRAQARCLVLQIRQGVPPMTCVDFKKLCEHCHPSNIDGLTKKAFIMHAQACPPCHAWLLARLAEEEKRDPDPTDDTFVLRRPGM